MNHHRDTERNHKKRIRHKEVIILVPFAPLVVPFCVSVVRLDSPIAGRAALRLGLRAQAAVPLFPDASARC